MRPPTTDETGIYLRKIGKTPLLSRDHEAAAAEEVCRTRRTFLTRLLASDYSLRVVLTAARKAAEHKLRIDRVLDVQGISKAARQAACDRLHAGVKVLRQTLRKNRRDLRIVADRRQPVERRKAARQLLLRRRRAAARQTSEAPVPGRSPEEAVGPPVADRRTHDRCRGTAQGPRSHARQRRAATCSPRGVAAPGPARRRRPPIAAAAAGRYSPALPRARGRLSRLHAAEPAAGGIDRKTICHDARRSAGPDPGGKSRPHAGGRQVRPRTGTPFLDVCLLVDSANDPPCPRAAAQRLSDLVSDDPEARQDPARPRSGICKRMGPCPAAKTGRRRGNWRPRNGEPSPRAAAAAFDRRFGR